MTSRRPIRGPFRHKKQDFVARCADLPSQLRQEDGSREKYQRFFNEMDKDGSKTIE